MRKSRVLFLKNIDREGPGFLLEITNELGLESDVVLLNDELIFSNFHSRYDFLVVLGGPSSANDRTFLMQRQVEFVGKWLASGKPYLGICLGMQIMVKATGGRVVSSKEKEIGFHHLGDVKSKYEVKLLPNEHNPLEGVLDGSLFPFQLHGETVILDETNIKPLATSNFCKHQILMNKERQIGLQFHIEMNEQTLRQCLKDDDDLIFINKELCLKSFKEQEKRLKQNCKSLLNYLLEGLI